MVCIIPEVRTARQVTAARYAIKSIPFTRRQGVESKFGIRLEIIKSGYAEMIRYSQYVRSCTWFARVSAYIHKRCPTTSTLALDLFTLT
jgi:hypothetical protein